MRTVLIVNVGNRDVQLSQTLDFPEVTLPQGLAAKMGRSDSRLPAWRLSGRLDENGSGCLVVNPREQRQAGEYLRAHWDWVRQYLRFPLLEEYLRLLSAEGQFPKQVFLIASDQADPQHRGSDTIGMADVLRQALRGKLVAAEAPDVRIHLCAAPADYDEAYRDYTHLLARIAAEVGPGPVQFCVGLSGGTPQMNAALLLAAARRPAGEVRFLYIPHGSSARELRLGDDLHREEIWTLVDHAVSSSDYAAARHLLQTNARLLDGTSPLRGLIALLDHAHLRLGFNLQAAIRALSLASKEVGAVERSTVLALRDGLAATQNEVDGDRYLLAELLTATRVYWQRQLYVDAVTRIVQFQEMALHSAALRLGIRFNKQEPDKLDPEWKQAQAARLQRLQQREPGLQLEPVTRKVLRALVAEWGASHAWVERLLSAAGRLEALGSIRNDWVHRLRGVDWPDLAAGPYASFREDRDGLAQAVFADMEASLAALGGTADDWPRQLAELVRRWPGRPGLTAGAQRA